MDNSGKYCCHSVTQSCLILCDPMDCSTPGIPVHHHLPEFAQTHVHWNQWCHPTISSSVIPFSSCPQPFPTSGSFPVSWLLAGEYTFLNYIYMYFLAGYVTENVHDILDSNFVSLRKIITLLSVMTDPFGSYSYAREISQPGSYWEQQIGGLPTLYVRVPKASN